MRHAENAIDLNLILRVDVQLFENEGAQIFRHARIDFDADDAAQAALFDQRFELADQIFGFFFKLDIGIAQDAEQAA